MRSPLVVAWRAAQGVVAGTILGVLAGLSLLGSGPEHGLSLLRFAGLGGACGGGWIWLWEWWQARELRRSKRRVGRSRRRGGQDNWPVSDG